MARFHDFNGMARLALFGSLAATVAFALPWLRLVLPGLSSPTSLAAQDVTGLNLAVAPAFFQPFATAPALGTLLVAALTSIALIAALASLLLALGPGLSSIRELNLEAGRKASIVGLVTSTLGILLTLLWIGPALGNLSIHYGGILVLVGFAVAAFAWPRARREGDDEDLGQH